MADHVGAYLRVKRYYDRLQAHPQLDKHLLHGLDVGTEHEAILTAADIKALLDMAPAAVLNEAARILRQERNENET